MSHWTSEDLRHRQEWKGHFQISTEANILDPIRSLMEYSIAEKEDLFIIPRNSHRPDLIPKPV